MLGRFAGNVPKQHEGPRTRAPAHGPLTRPLGPSHPPGRPPPPSPPPALLRGTRGPEPRPAAATRERRDGGETGRPEPPQRGDHTHHQGGGECGAKPPRRRHGERGPRGGGHVPGFGLHPPPQSLLCSVGVVPCLTTRGRHTAPKESAPGL